MTLLLETIEKHKRHHLKDKPIFIDGLSSRGKLSVHISNYIIGNKEFIEPKGVLIAASLIKFWHCIKILRSIPKNNFMKSLFRKAIGLLIFSQRSFDTQKKVFQVSRNMPCTLSGLIILKFT